ncbi:MAG: hypothetical protein M3340_18340, partial [Actinomycetota bacterium]|nr:hypothetical protein [Actinomycetota bacterium]
MTTPAPAPVRLAEPAGHDTSWELAREAALEVIRRRDAAWTDHNVHDPGITMLEAALWSLADLHYRVAERSWTEWGAEVAGEGREAAPRGTDERLRLAAMLRGPATELRRKIDEAASEEAAAGVVMA